MYVYEDARMRDLQARFHDICGMVDAEMEPVRRFAPNHRSEVYKAILKSLVIGDAKLVELGIQLALEKYPGGVIQIYPMLHLPSDTNERGGWHRDDKIYDRRVFWIPLTLYKYPGLSVIKWSEGLLSFPLAFAGSRLIDLDPVAQRLGVEDNKFYAWSPRMIHRGNLNTSDELSAAFVIFVDQGKPSMKQVLPTLTRDLVHDHVAEVTSAIGFNVDGQINRVDRARLDALPEPFNSHFRAFFQLRTKLDLTQWQPAAA